MSVPSRIRVQLVGFRPLARRFVADAVRGAPDMELLGELGESAPYHSSPAQADVVVVQATPDEPDPQEPMRVRSRVLEVFGGGCDVYERRLVRANIGVDELLQVIRETALVSGERGD
jgi:hypothetical protein